MAGNGNGVEIIAGPQNWPTDFRFLVKIQDVEPDFDKQPARVVGGHWRPPNRRIGIRATPNVSASYFRWRNGALEPITQQQYATWTQPHQPFGEATVFFSEDAFRAVPFNALRTSVHQHAQFPEWIDIGFHYMRISNPAQPPRVYSQLDFAPAYPRMASKNPNSVWIADLFPPTYHWQANDAVFQNAVNAGLIGRLDLILALSAFSARPDHVNYYLQNCVRRQKWAHHAENGRYDQRGILATVYVDPQSTTTAAQLRAFQNGTYGAFF